MYKENAHFAITVQLIKCLSIHSSASRISITSKNRNPALFSLSKILIISQATKGLNCLTYDTLARKVK